MLPTEWWGPWVWADLLYVRSGRNPSIYREEREEVKGCAEPPVIHSL